MSSSGRVLAQLPALVSPALTLIGAASCRVFVRDEEYRGFRFR